ncbi:MAG: NUDIX domain-containing protein [Clostridia bacterium]|nr:NUDIX domain-containing protein [Clostridia bacterium]
MRMPWNVFVYVYRRRSSGFEYLLLKRRDDSSWQGAAGGGEDGESPEEAAKREAAEETGLNVNSLSRLDTTGWVRAVYFNGRADWGPDIYVLPIYYFAAEQSGTVTLSGEHAEYLWTDYEKAASMLFWHDNLTALWELNERLKNNDIRVINED